MSKIYFGYITSTHGLKGELKCFSTFLVSIIKTFLPIHYLAYSISNFAY